MNHSLLALQVCIVLFFAGFMPAGPVQHASSDIHLLAPCDTIPQLNQKIISLVREQIGRTVDRGEC